MSSLTTELTLDTMCRGAVVEQFGHRMQAVIESLLDPNVPPDAKRTLTLKITFIADKSRETAGVEAKWDMRLPGPEGVGSTLFLGYGKEGFVAREHDPRQKGFDFVGIGGTKQAKSKEEN